jgi:hypothetical protein
MKYFDNFLKTDFETTIGKYSVSNFFTFIDVDALDLSIDHVNVDSKTTLLEASYKTYNDPNSFWTFVLANKTINPFTLCKVNSTLFKTENNDKLSFTLATSAAGDTGIAFPKGSIVLPYTANTGDSSYHSSTGNFNINGAFALIEDVKFYDGYMVLKNQQNGQVFKLDGSVGDRLTIIYPEGVAYYAYPSVYTQQKEKYLDQIIEVKDVNQGKTVIKSKQPSYKTPDESKETGKIVGDTGTTDISVSTYIDNQSRNIDAFYLSELGKLRSKFIKLKYG